MTFKQSVVMIFQKNSGMVYKKLRCCAINNGNHKRCQKKQFKQLFPFCWIHSEKCKVCFNPICISFESEAHYNCSEQDSDGFIKLDETNEALIKISVMMMSYNLHFEQPTV